MKGFRFNLQKAYFDKGMGLTYYIKYVIALFGLTSQDVKTTLIIAFFYCIFGYFLGRWWYLSGFVKSEIEVQNRFNIFVEEMRSKTFK